MSSSRPTILQVIPHLDAGGAEQTTIDIVEALVKARARALVATEGGRLTPLIEKRGGEIVSLPVATKNPAAIYWNASRIAAFCRREGVSLIHARSRAPAWSAFLAAQRLKLPFVTTYHGAYTGRSAIKTWYNGIMARGDVVIANSEFTARLIADRHGVSARRIIVIPRGVDLRRFDPSAIDAVRVAALRASWGVAEGQPVILNAARLTGWKGQRVLIDAAAELKRSSRLGDAVVVLAGDAQGRDGYAEELMTRIEDAGLEKAVLIVGHCTDMPAAFAAAAVSVVASTEAEAFGRAAAESLAMGTPVVVTDLGAPPETLAVSGGQEPLGWLAKPGDAAALASGIAEALALPPGKRADFAIRARAHVAEGFSLARMQEATLSVYDGLLGTALSQQAAAALAVPAPIATGLA